MGSRALAECLLRPSSRTLTLTTHPRLAPWTAQRCLSHTSPTLAARPAPTATSASTNAAQRTTSSRAAADQAIDDLFAAPPSTPGRAAAPAAPAAPTPDEAMPTSRVFGAAFSKPSSRGRLARTAKLNFGDMLMTDDLTNPSLANKPSPSTLAAQQTATFENYPRLNPSYGRSVDLDASRGRDIVRGIGMLGSLMARNKVKTDMNRQRFHERGGLKRKRLNSERWRARFKQGFRDVTGRVMELTRKGW
jgi:small subunit ribosomal protein MRP21